jgi:uncharacterized LabA/DUF88 family protein
VLLGQDKVNANIYVDGFNLYYGCLKNTAYRWLDLAALCRVLLPNDHINRIKYFTALVSARPNDPDQHVRQQTYIRALQTLPNLQVIYGHFLSHAVWMPLVNPVPGGPTHAQVIKTEEKGSDVNLATHLLNDGYQNDYELAVVVSNDSDLVEPIKIVISQLKLPVGVLNPHSGTPSQQLSTHAAFFRHIRPSALKVSQFPPSLTDSNGTFHKPRSW